MIQRLSNTPHDLSGGLDVALDGDQQPAMIRYSQTGLGHHVYGRPCRGSSSGLCWWERTVYINHVNVLLQAHHLQHLSIRH
jgi:hypothetical protein